LISKYFDAISLDTGKYCFGVEDTLKALDLGAVETLIVWENLDIARITLRNSAGELDIKHFNKEQEKERTNFIDPLDGSEMEVVEKMPMLEWLAEKYKDFGMCWNCKELRSIDSFSCEHAMYAAAIHSIMILTRFISHPPFDSTLHHRCHLGVRYQQIAGRLSVREGLWWYRRSSPLQARL